MSKFSKFFKYKCENCEANLYIDYNAIKALDDKSNGAVFGNFDDFIFGGNVDDMLFGDCIEECSKCKTKYIVRGRPSKKFLGILMLIVLIGGWIVINRILHFGYFTTTFLIVAIAYCCYWIQLIRHVKFERVEEKDNCV